MQLIYLHAILDRRAVNSHLIIKNVACAQTTISRYVYFINRIRYSQINILFFQQNVMDDNNYSSQRNVILIGCYHHHVTWILAVWDLLLITHLIRPLIPCFINSIMRCYINSINLTRHFQFHVSLYDTLFLTSIYLVL